MTIRPEDITPEYIIGLYRKHGLRPAAYTIFPVEGRCCMVGAIVVDDGKAVADIGGWCDRAQMLLGDVRFPLQNGFDAGFNGKTSLNGLAANNPFLRGFNIGKACYVAFNAD